MGGQGHSPKRRSRAVPPRVKLRPAGVPFRPAAERAPRAGTARAGREGPGTGLGRAELCLRPLGNGELWRQREGKTAAECPLRSGRSVKCRAGQGAAAAGFGAAEQPCRRERRDREGSGFSLRFSEGCRKYRCEWGGGEIPSPLPPRVPGCRAEWVRGAGTSRAPRSPHGVPSCHSLALGTAPARRHPAVPGPTGDPTPASPLSRSHPNAVAFRVSQNHRRPTLEGALELIP